MGSVESSVHFLNTSAFPKILYVWLLWVKYIVRPRARALVSPSRSQEREQEQEIRALMLYYKLL